MQQMANEWLLFGLILAGEFLFALGLAFLVRWMSKKGLRGQTLWMVVVGVAGTVSIAGPIVGWQTVGILAACFLASGIPMAAEYITRISDEHESARRTLESTLDEHPGADR